ncbi:TPA: serine/threonine protein kinase [Escherichia coli]|uniref:serine/threonine protein kinase n=1 Tax=Escherichia TaxID=561 RepID=UPI000854ED7C|nr:MULTISPECIES: protein kinase [Escherichia]MED9006840.1 protein kinase [Escherichia coli]OEN69592.1 nuclease PIN [Escherichia coli]RDS43515.1 Serine/threonine-protein kinase PK-1 [Escherichia coli]WDB54750.1 protein kinase [Escherichia albertii]HAO0304110.1 serine/threonine protein kinase [Escherichia coli]
MTDHENNRTVLNALPVGYRFNEFEIKEVIGGGGFGIVYRAWDHQLERTIAIKEFMPSSLAVRNEDMTLVLRSKRFSKAFSAGLNSFIQVARLLARFNHPNLLHVLRFWVQNDTVYMGTLFYSGTTLSRLREQQPKLIDEVWIRRMLPMLFGAIKTIHDAGYLHRDISPENIQIQDNGLPVLLDFGSARRTIGNLSDETETMLRPGYAPIEQYTDDNDSEQGAWTDIYAVGAVLHTLIVGSPPPVSVVRSIQDNYQPLAELKPAGYSLPLLQAVDKALALRVEDRPQSIDAFAKLIEMPVSSINDVLSVKKTGTMQVPVEKEEQMPATNDWRRYKVPGMVAAGVLVGIIAGGILFSGGGSEAQPGTQLPSAVTLPEITQTANTQPAPPVAVKESKTAAAAVPVAQVYVRMLEGEKLKLNGEPHNTQPATNGFASLKLAPGHYEITLQGNGQTREQTLEIARPGTWLINPSS